MAWRDQLSGRAPATAKTPSPVDNSPTAESAACAADFEGPCSAWPSLSLWRPGSTRRDAAGHARWRGEHHPPTGGEPDLPRTAVDKPVVMSTDQQHVANACWPAVNPVDDVMGMTHQRWAGTSGEATVSVPGDQRLPDRRARPAGPGRPTSRTSLGPPSTTGMTSASQHSRRTAPASRSMPTSVTASPSRARRASCCISSVSLGVAPWASGSRFAACARRQVSTSASRSRAPRSRGSRPS